MNLLIPYVRRYDHNDPLFDEFTYGDVGARGRKLRGTLAKGDYVFFHTAFGGKKYITAYYVVDRILDTAIATEDVNIVAKHHNPHLSDFLAGKRTAKADDAILFGDPITSRILKRPLPFDKALAQKLSLKIGFRKGKTEAQSIGSATRAWRKLTDKDAEVLLKKIKVHEEEGISAEAILSTDEVGEILERDIEGLLVKNPGLIGKSLKLTGRQVYTSVGRIDLLFKDRGGNFVVVELKLGRIGHDAINQLRQYMNCLKKETKRKVTGIIVCKGVMPAFEEDFRKLRSIKIFCYGWQLRVYPWAEKS